MDLKKHIEQWRPNIPMIASALAIVGSVSAWFMYLSKNSIPSTLTEPVTIQRWAVVAILIPLAFSTLASIAVFRKLKKHYYELKGRIFQLDAHTFNVIASGGQLFEQRLP